MAAGSPGEESSGCQPGWWNGCLRAPVWATQAAYTRRCSSVMPGKLNLV